MTLHLLGSPMLTVGDEQSDLAVSRPSLLLFYLALQRGWVRRDELAFFLRPDADRETGRQYLRKLLSSARRLPWAETLEIEVERVRWAVATDVERFQRAYGEGSWFEAVEFYRGALLQGLEAPFSPSFEVWLQSEREQLEHRWRDATLHYVADLEASGHHREAAAASKRLLDQDAFNEDALHSFLRNAYLMGQRELALRSARDFGARLLEEFDLELTPATQELIEMIRAARPLEKRVAAPRYGRRRSDTVTAAKSKQTQLGELAELLSTPDSRLVTLSGPDRGGLTMFIAKRIPDANTALLAVVDLAANLLAEGRRARALELLLIVLDHPTCNEALRKQINTLWPGLESQLLAK